MLPLRAGVARQVQLPQRKVVLQPRDGQQAVHVYEIHGKIQLVQVLVAVKALDVANVVDGDVEVDEGLQALQVLEPGDEVVLQVEDLEQGAQVAQAAADSLNVALVQRYLLQVRQVLVVVLRALAQHRLVDDDHWCKG